MQTHLQIQLDPPGEEGLLKLHFPVELPILVSVPPYWGDCGIADRSTPVIRWANKQARINVGRFSQEIPSIAHTFAEFLTTLVTIPGLEALQAASRYSLTLRVGRCFDRLEIAHQVVRLLLHAFYPIYIADGTPIVLEGKLENPTANPAETQPSTV